jgi:hypothetical protein
MDGCGREEPSVRQRMTTAGVGVWLGVVSSTKSAGYETRNR